MNKLFFKRIGFTISLLLLQIASFAQNAKDSLSPTFDATMRSHGKIYVVMAVVIVIVTVLFLYLIRIDIKISKKEKGF